MVLMKKILYILFFASTIVRAQWTPVSNSSPNGYGYMLKAGYDSISSNGMKVPVGAISIYSYSIAPTGYFICDGSAISRATYSVLFSLIGTIYGVGNGSTTFNIPDIRQKFIIGVASSGTGSTFAGTGGAIDHLHTVDPPSTTCSTDGAHTHTVDPAIATTSTPSATTANISLLGIGTAGGATHTHTIDIPSTTSSSNGNHSHTTDISSFNSGTANPPFIALYFIVKY